MSSLDRFCVLPDATSLGDGGGFELGGCGGNPTGAYFGVQLYDPLFAAALSKDATASSQLVGYPSSLNTANAYGMQI